jgi:predicted protein tyrosine phosphatase
MEIIVTDRDTITEMEFEFPYLVISITSVDGEWPDIPENEYCHGVLRMLYQDVDIPKDVDREELLTRMPDLVPFDTKMAREVLDFVAERKDVLQVICQCDFGISRSSATAAALGLIYLNDDSFIFSDIAYVPNRHVYRTLLKAHFGGMSRRKEDKGLKRLEN